jgi:hypothetical protein
MNVAYICYISLEMLLECPRCSPRMNFRWAFAEAVHGRLVDAHEINLLRLGPDFGKAVIFKSLSILGKRIALDGTI